MYQLVMHHRLASNRTERQTYSSDREEDNKDKYIFIYWIVETDGLYIIYLFNDQIKISRH